MVEPEPDAEEIADEPLPDVTEQALSLLLSSSLSSCPLPQPLPDVVALEPELFDVATHALSLLLSSSSSCPFTQPLVEVLVADDTALCDCALHALSLLSSSCSERGEAQFEPFTAELVAALVDAALALELLPCAQGEALLLMFELAARSESPVSPARSEDVGESSGEQAAIETPTVTTAPNTTYFIALRLIIFGLRIGGEQ